MIKGKKSIAVTPDLIATLDDELRSALPLRALGNKTAWRDERMAALRAAEQLIAACRDEIHSVPITLEQRLLRRKALRRQRCQKSGALVLENRYGHAPAE